MTNNLSAGRPVKALDFPRAQQMYLQTNISNVSATTYAPGAPEVAVRFLAPSTGRVAVSVSGGVSNNGANADRMLLTYRILEGDPNNGVVIQDGDSKRGVSNAGTGGENNQFAGHVTMVDGLTPGTYYYAQLVHRTVTGAGTADLTHRVITVWPIP